LTGLCALFVKDKKKGYLLIPRGAKDETSEGYTSLEKVLTGFDEIGQWSSLPFEIQ